MVCTWGAAVGHLEGSDWSEARSWLKLLGLKQGRSSSKGCCAPWDADVPAVMVPTPTTAGCFPFESCPVLRLIFASRLVDDVARLPAGPDSNDGVRLPAWRLPLAAAMDSSFAISEATRTRPSCALVAFLKGLKRAASLVDPMQQALRERVGPPF